ncbi:trehalase-like domain-containing protein [Arthrobacter sp. UYEF20]|uniref:trehalase-like domain-containing protein n=1 Tax=Arthrobacter sp. UYEF20 TaxID=1756363 RepID=UPI003394EA44
MERIEDYAIIGDLHTAALVGTDGSIGGLCLPYFDPAACFAALSGTSEAGHWLLAPAGGGTCTRRRYRRDTLVLETEWDTGTGRVRVTDFMPPRDETADIVRIVEGLSGTVAMQSELALRFDYGHLVPCMRRTTTGIHAVAGPDSVHLSSTAPMQGEHFRTLSGFTVGAGDRVPFVLTWSPSHLRPPRTADADEALARTVDYWQECHRAAGPRGRTGTRSSSQ